MRNKKEKGGGGGGSNMIIGQEGLVACTEVGAGG